MEFKISLVFYDGGKETVVERTISVPARGNDPEETFVSDLKRIIKQNGGISKVHRILTKKR
jgi:hypothetical protein